MVKVSETLKAEQPSKSTEPAKKKYRILRKGLDLEHLNLVPKDAIPPKSKVSTPYRELLKRIPKGQAAVLTEHDVSLDTAAAAIRRFQRRGEYQNFKVTRRIVDGQKRLYVINKDAEPECKGLVET